MKKYDRRTFLSRSLKGAAGLAAVSMIPFGISRFNDNGNMGTGMGNGPAVNSVNESALTGEIRLPIPPLLENKSKVPNKAEFHLNAQMGKTEFIQGKATETFGYNGDYLGPVIRVRKGDDVSIEVNNDLNEDTTVHWHGLEVSGEYDGGPHSIIKAGGTWNPRFTIDQPAATLWYHPHLMHKTGEHVYKGLAGLFYIDDDVSDSLNIPNEYGVNDVPLVIQDKKLDANGRFEYRLSMHDVMMGMQGGTILVNGAINPFLEVPKGKMRLRVLNGSNARIYELFLSSNQRFHQIASDGGLLENPVEMNGLLISPGERAEIVVDFSDYDEGETVELIHQGAEVMKFKVTEQNSKDHSLPATLAPIKKIDPYKAGKARKFVMQGMGRNVNINGKQMDMDRIDEYLDLNSTEIWEITTESGGMGGMMGGMAHPFHAHGAQFQLLERNGTPPPANEAGWKDTFLVYPRETIRVIATFKHPGLFMYHCHILEHEDAGMMGQFKVE
ncbi:multicopper oxidase family protein [Bacillus marinisedimentorum]|uniref:multicopper oxidase family protein n=1 Tax=Bacillus marinisedimentorum TaxID=1821260 RepID=UPI0007DE8959|nr:multicopper oxidase domain-containing protein [Bacillus marinisedimentorum]